MTEPPQNCQELGFCQELTRNRQLLSGQYQGVSTGRERWAVARNAFVRVLFVWTSRPTAGVAVANVGRLWRSWAKGWGEGGCSGHTGETPRPEPRRLRREMPKSLQRFELAAFNLAETGLLALGIDLAKQRGVQRKVRCFALRRRPQALFGHRGNHLLHAHRSAILG